MDFPSSSTVPPLEPLHLTAPRGCYRHSNFWRNIRTFGEICDASYKKNTNNRDRKSPFSPSIPVLSVSKSTLFNESQLDISRDIKIIDNGITIGPKIAFSQRIQKRTTISFLKCLQLVSVSFYGFQGFL